MREKPLIYRKKVLANLPVTQSPVTFPSTSEQIAAMRESAREVKR